VNLIGENIGAGQLAVAPDRESCTPIELSQAIEETLIKLVHPALSVVRVGVPDEEVVSEARDV
jgi:hypothetical protein